MIPRPLCRRLCLSFLLALPLCMADTILLDNDSRLVGEITSVRAENVALKTDFAGSLTIPLGRIVALQTDGPLRVAVTDLPEMVGPLSLREGTCEVQTAEGPRRAAVADLLAAGPADQPLVIAEPPKAPRRWTYEASGSYRGKSGNTDSTSMNLGAKVEWKGEKEKLKLYTTWVSTEENDRQTEDVLIGGVDFERQLDTYYSWYARTEMERDTIEQVSLRATTAAGFGYYLVKNPVRELRLRSGLQYRRESFDYDEEDNSALGLEFGVHHTWKISTWGMLANDITYTAAFDNWADYRVLHESSLDIPLVRSKIWKVRLGLSHEYNSLSAPGTEDLDTTYFLKLVFNWR